MKEWFSLHPESELAWPPCGAVPATSAASAPAPAGLAAPSTPR